METGPQMTGMMELLDNYLKIAILKVFGLKEKHDQNGEGNGKYKNNNKELKEVKNTMLKILLIGINIRLVTTEEKKIYEFEDIYRVISKMKERNGENLRNLGNNIQKLTYWDVAQQLYSTEFDPQHHKNKQMNKYTCSWSPEGKGAKTEKLSEKNG
jgi:hypothetical protein